MAGLWAGRVGVLGYGAGWVGVPLWVFFSLKALLSWHGWLEWVVFEVRFLDE